MSELYTGRRVIYTDEKYAADENIGRIIAESMTDFRTNQSQISYLYQYYKGNQPILNRIKKVRPEINNKIVENRANEIVNFKTGYLMGEPVQYVGRNGADLEEISYLNSLCFECSKHAMDKEIAEWFYICGTAYRMILPSPLQDDPDIPPFEIHTLDPRNTFVVYSSDIGHRPIIGAVVVKRRDGTETMCVYSENHYWEIKTGEIIKSEPHALGMIPIIEYPVSRSRLGAFEIVMPLLDAINRIESNRVDGIEQFIQALMVFVNCQIDETLLEKLREFGAAQLKSTSQLPADIRMVTGELNQTQVQTLIDYMYQTVLTICGMPNRNGQGNSTSDTGSAVILREGWSDTEARTRSDELLFKESEKVFLRLLLKILRNTPRGCSLKLSQIDIKFTRRAMENLLTKTQTLQGLLSAGIHPLEAIATSGLFNDATDIYHKSEEYLTKYLPANDREVVKTQNIRDDNKTQENDREVNKTQEGETA